MSQPEDDDEAIASLLAPRFRRSPSGAPPPDATAEPSTADPVQSAPAPSPGTTSSPAAIDDLPDSPAPSAAPAAEPAPLTADAALAVVGDERFLPVADPVLIRPLEPGPLRIFVPQGSAVHVIEGGRVAEIDGHLAGEVTIRADGDRFYHYRRLMPSSVRVASGEPVTPGTVIGTVGEAVDTDPPCLVVGLRSGDGPVAATDVKELLLAHVFGAAGATLRRTA